MLKYGSTPSVVFLIRAIRPKKPTRSFAFFTSNLSDPRFAPSLVLIAEKVGFRMFCVGDGSIDEKDLNVAEKCIFNICM